MNCHNCGAELQPTESACAHCGAASTISTLPLAGAWPRFWARSLDVTLWLLLCGAVLEFRAPTLLDAGGSANAHLVEQFLGLMSLPVAMAGDALTYMLFGNTPGKWAAGLRVRDLAGNKLRPLQYLLRNSRVYVHGLALGLWLIAIVTMIEQYRRVRSGALTSWDVRLESRVLHVRGGMLRVSLAASVVLMLALSVLAGLLVGTFGLPEWAKPMSPEENLQWMASIANENAPSMLDERIRLDRVSVAPGLVLQFDHTLINENLPETSFDTDLQRKQVVKSVCENLSFALDQHARVRFRYADRDGKPLGAIDVSKADCTKEL